MPIRRAEIVMPRALGAFGVVALCAVLAVPVAVGKGRARARLDTPLPLSAAPGTTITIAWALSSAERGVRHPFDADGLFVRLLSASGGRPTKAYGRGSTGRYVARLRVPSGGIGGIAFGLVGLSSGEEADVYFPLENNPLPIHASAPHRSSTPARTTGTAWPATLWAAAIAMLCAVRVSLSVHRLVPLRGARHGDRGRLGSRLS